MKCWCTLSDENDHTKTKFFKIRPRLVEITKRKPILTFGNVYHLKLGRQFLLWNTL